MTATIEKTETEIPTRGPQTFTIPRSYLTSLNTVIDRANRRLARANVEEQFTFTHEVRMEEDSDNPGTFRQVADVVLNTPTISAGGYSFLAAIVKEENGFVVRSATGVELDGWRPDAMMCDHCGQRRRRNKTYLVSTPEGERMQVGSTCLQPLLGMNPAGLWALIYDIEIPESDERGRTGGADDLRVPTRYIIAMALTLSRMGENYVSKKAVSNGYDGISTSEAVKSALFDRTPQTREEREAQAITAKRVLETEESLITEIIAGSKTVDPTSDYQMNMNVIMESEWTKPRNIGYVVSAIAMWNRARQVQHETETRVNNSTPGYVDEVEAKIRNLEVIVTDIENFPDEDHMGNFIYRSRVNFKDGEGHEILWWASRVIDVNKDDVVVITSATVKNHNTYRGVDQTVITRARLKSDA